MFAWCMELGTNEERKYKNRVPNFSVVASLMHAMECIGPVRNFMLGVQIIIVVIMYFIEKLKSLIKINFLQMFYEIINNYRAHIK